MRLIEEAQKLADKNGDGALNTEDISQLAEQFGLDTQAVEDIKSQIENNGNINVTELQEQLSSFSEGNFGGIIDFIKNKFFN
jgi:Ca2+-binding EF-hand superfamily protein